jgi:hypothetical protein
MKYVTKRDDGCWEWTGYRNRLGYGQMTVNRKSWTAHRYSFHIHNPSVEIEGWDILHSCDNRWCVAPNHLRRGDHADNMRDRAERSDQASWHHESRKTHCPKGHPYDEENTYWYPSGRQRGCRICRADLQREWRARKRL